MVTMETYENEFSDDFLAQENEFSDDFIAQENGLKKIDTNPFKVWENC